jgi:hypothetical protein
LQFIGSVMPFIIKCIHTRHHLCISSFQLVSPNVSEWVLSKHGKKPKQFEASRNGGGSPLTVVKIYAHDEKIYQKFEHGGVGLGGYPKNKVPASINPVPKGVSTGAKGGFMVQTPFRCIQEGCNMIGCFSMHFIEGESLTSPLCSYFYKYMLLDDAILFALSSLKVLIILYLPLPMRLFSKIKRQFY